MSTELVGFRSVALGGCGEGDLLCSAIDNLNLNRIQTLLKR